MDPSIRLAEFHTYLQGMVSMPHCPPLQLGDTRESLQPVPPDLALREFQRYMRKERDRLAIAFTYEEPVVTRFDLYCFPLR